MPEATDEENGRRGFPERIEGLVGYVEGERDTDDPNILGSSRHGRHVSLGKDHDRVEQASRRALVPTPGGELDASSQPPHTAGPVDELGGPSTRRVVIDENLGARDRTSSGAYWAMTWR